MPEAQPYPAKRSLIEANEGHVDGELNRVKGLEKDYPNLVMVPVRVNHLKNAIFMHVSHEGKIHSLDDLKKYRIGILRGLQSTAELSEGLDRVFINTGPQALGMLSKHRIDAFIAPQLAAQFMIQQYHVENISNESIVVSNTNTYHFLHKKHQGLIQKISTALQSMHDSGRYEEIRNQAIMSQLK